VWLCDAEEQRFRPSDGVLWWSRIWALVVMVELSIRFQLLPWMLPASELLVHFFKKKEGRNVDARRGGCKFVVPMITDK
jgi:hypothetical protein